MRSEACDTIRREIPFCIWLFCAPGCYGPEDSRQIVLIIAADRREAAHYSCDTRVENRHSARDVVNFMT